MLASPGIGSGLDINGIVSQLMAIERRLMVDLHLVLTGFVLLLAEVKVSVTLLHSLKTTVAVML